MFIYKSNVIELAKTNTNEYALFAQTLHTNTYSGSADSLKISQNTQLPRLIYKLYCAFRITCKCCMADLHFNCMKLTSNCDLSAQILSHLILSRFSDHRDILCFCRTTDHCHCPSCFQKKTHFVCLAAPLDMLCSDFSPSKT